MADSSGLKLAGFIFASVTIAADAGDLAMVVRNYADGVYTLEEDSRRGAIEANATNEADEANQDGPERRKDRAGRVRPGRACSHCPAGMALGCSLRRSPARQISGKTSAGGYPNSLKNCSRPATEPPVIRCVMSRS